MRSILLVEEIKDTPTYRALVAKKEIIKIGFLEKRSQREIITNGLAVYKNTGTIPGNVSGTNLLVLKDLIKSYLNNIKVNE